MFFVNKNFVDSFRGLSDLDRVTGNNPKNTKHYDKIKPHVGGPGCWRLAFGRCPGRLAGGGCHTTRSLKPMNTRLLIFVGAVAAGYFLAGTLAQYPVFQQAFTTGASIAPSA